MLSEKSIKSKYLSQLIIASALLLGVFALAIYFYIRMSAYDDIVEDMKKEAEAHIQKINATSSLDVFSSSEQLKDNIDIAIRVNKSDEISHEFYKKNDINYIALFYPYDKTMSSYVKVQRDITNTENLLNKMLQSTIFAGFLAIGLIFIFATILSETLLSPIRTITGRLSRMNENFLEKIDTKALPDEFIELGESINKLIDRIQIFVKYQRELFVGIAHELKTPLAVMKAKNEVTLMKERDSEQYKETMQVSNKSIDNMNKMISSVLEIGRQEGAQFEQPIEMDMIVFLKDKIKDFTLLAKTDGKNIKSDISPEKYLIVSQPTLITHILQNFVQNAVKFTHKGGTIEIRSRLENNLFKVEVIDEGEGIDEFQDLFAPFKRFGEKSGVGLGLFLAKGAADTIGATLSIKNRKDRQGAIATLTMDARNYCPIEGKIIKQRNRKMIFSYPLGK